VAVAHTAELQAEADKEAARAKDKFVGACIAWGPRSTRVVRDRALHARDREKHKRCMKIVNDLEAKMFAH